jgi:hypothetical protein
MDNITELQAIAKLDELYSSDTSVEAFLSMYVDESLPVFIQRISPHFGWAQSVLLGLKKVYSDTHSVDLLSADSDVVATEFGTREELSKQFHLLIKAIINAYPEEGPDKDLLHALLIRLVNEEKAYYPTRLDARLVKLCQNALKLTSSNVTDIQAARLKESIREVTALNEEYNTVILRLEQARIQFQRLLAEFLSLCDEYFELYAKLKEVRIEHDKWTYLQALNDSGKFADREDLDKEARRFNSLPERLKLAELRFFASIDPRALAKQEPRIMDAEEIERYERESAHLLRSLRQMLHPDKLSQYSDKLSTGQMEQLSQLFLELNELSSSEKLGNKEGLLFGRNRSNEFLQQALAKAKRILIEEAGIYDAENGENRAESLIEYYRLEIETLASQIAEAQDTHLQLISNSDINQFIVPGLNQYPDNKDEICKSLKKEVFQLTDSYSRIKSELEYRLEQNAGAGSS